MRRLSVAATLVVLSATGAGAQVVYSNDFNGGSTANLTATGGGVSTLAPFGACTSATYCTPYLGRANGNPFDNQTVTLSLAALPAHSDATVAFSLFILNSWDGNNTGFGPDRFTVVADGGTLLNTTFDITGNTQCFPNDCPAANASRTGAVENNTLGANFFGNSVYELTFTFAHTAPTLAVTFTGSNLQGWSDEGWGMDNLRVTLTPAQQPGIVPEPSTYALMATGLLALGGIARRRRQG
jgi:hypothetical protein